MGCLDGKMETGLNLITNCQLRITDFQLMLKTEDRRRKTEEGDGRRETEDGRPKNGQPLTFHLPLTPYDLRQLNYSLFIFNLFYLTVIFKDLNHFFLR
jgi:hypothetical protein